MHGYRRRSLWKVVCAMEELQGKNSRRCHCISLHGICVSQLLLLFAPFFLWRRVCCPWLILRWRVVAGSLIYEKLGERAFGWPGKMAAFGSIIMQNIGGRQSNSDVLLFFFALWYNVTVCAHMVAKFRTSVNLKHVLPVLQPCPATSSSWSTSCPRWSEPSWLWKRAPGECARFRRWMCLVCGTCSLWPHRNLSLQWVVPERELPGGVRVHRNHPAFVSP